jgi:hypothetical protein
MSVGVVGGAMLVLKVRVPGPLGFVWPSWAVSE